MFLSMDMNVLAAATTADAQNLLGTVGGLLKRKAYLRFRGQLLLSTFAGHDKTFGGWGWQGFLDRLNGSIGEKVRYCLQLLVTNARCSSSRPSSCLRTTLSGSPMWMVAMPGTTLGTPISWLSY